MYKSLTITFLLFTLSACVTINNTGKLQFPCSISDDNQTLTLSGQINQDMLLCVQSHTSKPIQTVVLNSQGGAWSAGLNIANILATFDADMVVENECNSSCANYFIPVAKSVRINKNAYFALHGSFDKGLLKKALLEAKTKEKEKQLVKDHQNHLMFLEKYNVPKGWFLYRTAEEYGTKSFGKHIDGKPKTWEDIKATKVLFLLVEELFIRSCLKNVKVYPFENTKVQQMYINKKIRKKITKQGFFPTGSMRCKVAI
ncbi:MAG: hypothetical protein V3U57_04465 [Robiginitomaculum sp.]